MAKNRDRLPADGFTAAGDFGPAVPDDPIEPAVGATPVAFDPRDARIAELEAENAKLKGVSGSLAGGRFTVGIKDGPTATVEAAAGESPEQAFFRTLGIHSTPHRCTVEGAAEGAPLGIHLPGGSVRPFAPQKG